MPNLRSHRFALPLTLAVLALVLTACGGGVAYPNSTFNSTTEVNDLSTHLWDKLLFWGTVVFVIVEAILLYTIIRYRRKEGAPDPEQIHGNTALEITWTVIPVLILALIAVPTVETIFKTQAKAPADALEVEVIGHQWWWEFRYPSLGVTTANELYLPAGKTVNFSLVTKDVLHSFWVPQLGGKRDLISNHTNHIWYTPKDSLAMSVFNGFCVEYCGASHANMRFRAYVVSPSDFEAWAAHNADMAMMRDPEPTAAPAAAPTAKPTVATAAVAAAPAVPAAPAMYMFPKEKIPAYAWPNVPVANIPFDESLLAQGDAERGRQIYSSNACIGCHMVKGNRMSAGVIGPNLTHFGSRYTFGGGLFRTEPAVLARWIKNARAMKPGVLMNTLGKDQYDPVAKMTVTAGGLDDRQIADIVAYLMALK